MPKTSIQNAYDLSCLNAIKVIGERSREFLQGQLTCDMNLVSTEHPMRGALCNTKGRVLALLDIYEYPDGFYLILPKDLVEKTLKSLSKTAALSRITLEVDAHHYFTGLFEANQFYIKRATAKPNGPLLPYTSWHHDRLKKGDVQIYPETRGLFLPHQLGLHKSGQVCFDKGCYKGQEIIARMHYLGKLKYEFKLFCVETDLVMKPGLKFRDINHKPLGEILDSCLINPNHWLIAVSIKPEHEEKVLFEGYEGTSQLTSLQDAL